MKRWCVPTLLCVCTSLVLAPVVALPGSLFAQSSVTPASEPAIAETRAVASEPAVAAMQQELSRSLRELSLPNRAAAYYGAYWLVDYEQLYVRASSGELISKNEDRGRRLRVELRVGDAKIDNSNFSGNGGGGDFGAYDDNLELAPQGEDIQALRRAFWLASDAAYRGGVELLDDKLAQRSGQVELQARPPDFSTEQLQSTVVPRAKPLPNLLQLQDLAVAASRAFREYPVVDEGSIAIQAWWIQRTLVTSQGVVSREPTVLIQFQLQASSQAPDGMPVAHARNVFGELDEQQLTAEVRRMASGVTEAAQAELITDSYGPVLFAGTAAAQIAHELLAMNLSGTPQGEATEGAFSRRLGKRVLPESFQAFDDPLLQEYQGLRLIGHYALDDEGVRSRRVNLVQNGRLQSLLMSRTPSREFTVSTGHGRSGLSGWARGMVGNLVLHTKGGVSPAQLQRKLLAAAKEQGVAYGIVIERLTERSFATGGMSPPAPEQAYKLFLDGRRVAVRGGELSEINVRDLRTLLAVGKQPNVYNYVLTWPSGVPSGSSVVAPDLLFEEVELTQPKRSYRRPKVLPRPAP